MVERLVLFVDGQNVHTDIEFVIAVTLQPFLQPALVALNLTNQQRWMVARDRLGGSFQRVELHALHVDLDQVDPAKPK